MQSGDTIIPPKRMLVTPQTPTPHPTQSSTENKKTGVPHSTSSSPALARLHRLEDVYVSPDVVALVEGDVAARRDLVRHATSLHASALEGTGGFEGLLPLGGLGGCLAVGGGAAGSDLASAVGY